MVALGVDGCQLTRMFGRTFGRGYRCLCYITENVMSRSMISEVTLQSCLCLSTAMYLWFLVASIDPQQISSKSLISIFPQESPRSQDCGVICIGAAASP